MSRRKRFKFWAKWWHGVFVTTSDDVFSFGCNGCGRLGNSNENTSKRITEVLLPKKMKIRNVSLGAFHTIFVSEKGVVFACGDQSDGKLGAFAQGVAHTPIRLKFFNTQFVYNAFAGYDSSFFSCTLSETCKTVPRRTFSCGNNARGQLGCGDRSFVTSSKNMLEIGSPKIMEITDCFPSGEFPVQVEGGRRITVFLSNRGFAYLCGDVSDTNVKELDLHLPTRIEFPGEMNKNLRFVQMAYEHDLPAPFFLTKSGTLHVLWDLDFIEVIQDAGPKVKNAVVRVKEAKVEYGEASRGSVKKKDNPPRSSSLVGWSLENPIDEVMAGSTFNSCVRLRKNGQIHFLRTSHSNFIVNNHSTLVNVRGKDFANICVGEESVMYIRNDGAIFGGGDDSFEQVQAFSERDEQLKERYERHQMALGSEAFKVIVRNPFEFGKVFELAEMTWWPERDGLEVFSMQTKEKMLRLEFLGKVSEVYSLSLNIDVL